MTPNSLRTLLTDLVDYAGLFPPASLSMAHAAEAYKRALVSEDEWMLGRFICPVSRLGEFEKAAGLLLPGTQATSGYREAGQGDAWRLSVTLDTPLGTALDAIDAFNQLHATPEGGLAVIDAIEMKVSTGDEIDAALDEVPEDVFPFFEITASQDCRGLIAALAGEAAAAKIRMGGVTPQAFPTPSEVVAFLGACAAAEVPFKATAGLHHPIRGPYRLTYEPGSATCPMYGFLNVFLAAALVRIKRVDAGVAEALLVEEDPAEIRFADGVVSWRGHGLETGLLAKVREAFALSMGSCSFDEPTADLRTLGWL